jgi:hypothetical protein
MHVADAACDDDTNSIGSFKRQPPAAGSFFLLVVFLAGW